MDNIKRIFFRIRNILILILLMNIVVINAAHRENRGLFIVMSAILICLYFYINIVPLKTKKLNKRLNNSYLMKDFIAAFPRKLPK